MTIDRVPSETNVYRLVAFLRVAETLNFSEAARQLCIAQPAVSRHVKELEKAIGARLFDRTGRGVALTEVGTRLVRHARSLIAAAQRWEEAVENVRGVYAGDLKLAASPGWVRILLKAIEAFAEARPMVAVGLTMAPSKRVVDLVIRREVHLGFLPFVPDMVELVAMPMGTDQILLVAAPNHPLVSSLRTPGQLGDILPLVHSADAELVPEAAQDYLNSFGLTIATRVELESAGLVKEAILDGLGVGLQFKSNIQVELARGLLIPLFPDGPPCTVTTCAIRSRRRLFGPIQEAFLTQVADSAPRFRDQG